MLFIALLSWMPVLMAVIVFTAVILGLSYMLIYARKKLVPQGDVKIIINGDVENPLLAKPGSSLLSTLGDSNIFLPSEMCIRDRRPSVSGTIPSYGKDCKFEADTNTHGEKRAFVVTGQYESVLPMDIFPQHVMKAIITNNIERMEGLGLAELSEEDVALCEFVCTSKNPVQSILRQGLESLKEQS